MKLLIRCLWMPPPNALLESRLAEIARIGGTVRLLACVGPRWYMLGRSRKDALKHEVRIEEVHTSRTCRRVPLIEGECYWTLDVWNGRSSEEVANLHFSLFDPPSSSDVIFVSFERGSLGGACSWSDILATARQLADELGGHAVVTSHQLQEEAARRNLAGAGRAAYAAFWGRDRSGRNPLYRWLAASGRTVPAEMVACDSWDELARPESGRLHAITETLVAVARGAGESV